MMIASGSWPVGRVTDPCFVCVSGTVSCSMQGLSWRVAALVTEEDCPKASTGELHPRYDLVQMSTLPVVSRNNRIEEPSSDSSLDSVRGAEMMMR